MESSEGGGRRKGREGERKGKGKLRRRQRVKGGKTMCSQRKRMGSQ